MFIEVGNNHYVNSDRILAVGSIHHAAMLRTVKEARKEGVLIDFAGNKACKAILIMDTGVVIKIAIRPMDLHRRIVDNANQS